MTRPLALLISSFLILGAVFGSASTAIAADPSEMTGTTVDGRWLGSFNTKAPIHSFCIDGFKGYPRASYKWTSVQIKAPKAAYLLWRFGQNPNVTDATALSWYIHATNEIGHQNAKGYKDLPKSALPSGVAARIDTMQDLAHKNAGPYRLKLDMKNQVSGNKLVKGSVRLLGGRGQVIKDNFGTRKIKVSLQGGRFASGKASRTFFLANGVGQFQYRRVASNTGRIQATASINYGPIKVLRSKSDVPTAQRVVSRLAGEPQKASASTNIKVPNLAEASVRLIKHGTGSGGSYPVADAVFAITKTPARPSGGADRERSDDDGEVEFDGLDVNTTYYLHEMVAPPGHSLPSPNPAIQVTTGGPNSTVTARGGNPVINSQSTFDLALVKYIHAVNNVETGQNGTGTPEPTKVAVGDIVQHRIIVYNQGETAGWAEQIVDYLPAGYDFVEDLNPDWTYHDDSHTATLNTSEHHLPANPHPGIIDRTEPRFSVDIYLKVNSKLYTEGSDAGVNFAEICEDGNDFDYPDVDSTPDCDKENDPVGGDNIVNNDNGDEDDHDFDEVSPAPLNASTKAISHVKTGDLIYDTLTTTAPMPEGLQIRFRVYDNPTCSGEPLYTSKVIETTENENHVIDPDGYKPTKPGKYFWVATITDPSGQNEYFRDECGTPDEISNVYSITTAATPSMQLGGQIEDVAKVEGDLPGGSSIRFKLYGPNDPKCETKPVYVSDLIPTEPGKTEYLSGKTRTQRVGVHRWVEELVDQDERTVLTKGECGLEQENSHIWNISTVALTGVTVGRPIYDTANVSGSVPKGTKLRFKLHGEQDLDCRNPIFTSRTQPVKGEGYYRSENFTPKKPGDYYWVEELIGSDGKVIARGVCGAENEISIVKESSITKSGTKTPKPDAPDSEIVDKPIPVTG